MKNKLVALWCAVLFVSAFVVVAHAQAPAKAAGTWTLSYEQRSEDKVDTLTLTQDGTKLGGSIKGDLALDGSTLPVDNGAVSGNTITFTVTKVVGSTASGPKPVPMNYKATITGDTMKGTFTTAGFPTDFTGKR
jgi:hypothetical protein